MSDGKSEKVRIMVAFGDISGFTSFCESVTNDEVEYDPFMEEFDQLIDTFARETGYQLTDTGDGFMCTIDLPTGHACTTAIKALIDLWRLLKRLEDLVRRKKEDPPAPDGVRIVGAAGYVKRKIRDGGHVSYRGRHINKAHNALNRARGKGLVCENSLKVLIGEQQAKKHGLKFTKLDKELWILTCLNT